MRAVSLARISCNTTLMQFVEEWSDGVYPQEPASLCGFAVSGSQELCSSQLPVTQPRHEDIWSDRPKIPLGQEMDILMLLSGHQQATQHHANSICPSGSLDISPSNITNISDEPSHTHHQSCIQHKVSTIGICTHAFRVQAS